MAYQSFSLIAKYQWGMFFYGITVEKYSSPSMLWCGTVLCGGGAPAELVTSTSLSHPFFQIFHRIFLVLLHPTLEVVIHCVYVILAALFSSARIHRLLLVLVE